MFSNAKAIALCRDLADKLRDRFLASGSALTTITESFFVDAENASWPVLTISDGTVTEGSAVILIEISNVDAVSKDIFGNDTYTYAPHILQLAYELSSGGAPIPATADILTVEFEAIKTGVRLQLKAIPNGTAVTAATVNAAAATVDLDDLEWPTKLV